MHVSVSKSSNIWLWSVVGILYDVSLVNSHLYVSNVHKPTECTQRCTSIWVSLNIAVVYSHMILHHHVLTCRQVAVPCYLSKLCRHPHPVYSTAVNMLYLVIIIFQFLLWNICLWLLQNVLSRYLKLLSNHFYN